MHRLLAAIVLALAVAAPARADTNITVFGGFGFSTGSHSMHQFRHHHHRHHHGSIWSRSHELGGGFFFHRTHRNHHLGLSSHPELFIAPRKHRHSHGHSSFFFHTKRHAPEPRVIVIIPAPLDGAIVTLGGHSSVIVVDRTRHSRPVPLPARKPFAIAISPPAQ